MLSSRYQDLMVKRRILVFLSLMSKFVLSRPKLNQSNRATIRKIIEDIYGRIQRDQKLDSVVNAHKNPKLVQNWIDTVDKIQRNRFAPSVVYSNRMPEIDTLMQAWDPEFERFLEDNPLPEADLDIPIDQLARYASALLDIPVHEQNQDKNLIESMHVLFSLYSAFNEHFQGQTGQAAQ